MICLRILAKNQGELDIFHGGHQRSAPGRRAFRSWRQIATLPGPRVAETHRENGKLTGIVKSRAINAQPVSQAVPAWVIKWYAGVVHAAAWSLACDKNLRFGVDLKHGARTKRECRLADFAGAHPWKQLSQGSHVYPI
jgi:hypothetical protein